MVVMMIVWALPRARVPKAWLARGSAGTGGRPSSPCLPGSLLSTAQPAARPHRPSPETLQVENLLLSNQGTIKLCDFGSATTISHYPDYSWSAQRRALVEEEVSAAARTPPPPVPAPAGSSVAYALM